MIQLFARKFANVNLKLLFKVISVYDLIIDNELSRYYGIYFTEVSGVSSRNDAPSSSNLFH